MPHHFLWIFLIFLDFSPHKKVCSPLSATKSRGVRGVNYLKKIPYTFLEKIPKNPKKSRKIPKNPPKNPKNPQKIPKIPINPKSRTSFFRVMYPSIWGRQQCRGRSTKKIIIIINQSINQSTSQSINQSINQSIDRLIIKSIN